MSRFTITLTLLTAMILPLALVHTGCERKPTPGSSADKQTATSAASHADAQAGARADHDAHGRADRHAGEHGDQHADRHAGEQADEHADHIAGGPAGDHVHDADASHDHDDASPAAPGQGHHLGESIALGTASVDGMNVRAARDAGEIKPGGDVAIDVWIDGGLGNAAAVRFWIGTEDARRFVKSKAEIEEDKWHTHAEVPDPLPAESKLWVEIEGKDGRRSLVAFELRP